MNTFEPVLQILKDKTWNAAVMNAADEMAPAVFEWGSERYHLGSQSAYDTPGTKICGILYMIYYRTYPLVSPTLLGVKNTGIWEATQSKLKLKTLQNICT